MKLLVVDDHEIVQQGLAAYFRQRDAGLTLLVASSGEEACALLPDHPDLDAVLLDLAMPGMGGLALIVAMGALRRSLPVVVLSAFEEPARVREALSAGARGYIPKSAGGNTLWSALQFVLSGNVYVPPLMLADAATAGPSARAAPAEAMARLTPRQADVLRLLAEGTSNKQIARTLDLSEKTVKIHVTGIFKALDVVNRRQAAALSRACPAQ